MSQNDAEHPPADTAATADAFALVGNELRAEIIRVLGAADGLEASFSEVRSRVDMTVKPSQLHYHLQQLVGHFVVKTNGSYRLSAAGIRLCLTLHAGTFDRRQEQLSIDANADCYYCQTSVEAIFDNGFVEIECPDCKHTYGHDFLDFPLAVFENEVTAFSHFRSYIILKNFFIARGVCPSCTHPLSPAFRSTEDHPDKVRIYQSCGLCGIIRDLSVGMALLADPDLIAFCYDHGVDLLSTPYWELEFAATDDNVTIRSTDPWEVVLEVTFDGETLELVVDGDLNVVERNLSDPTDGRSTLSLDEIFLPTTADCLQSLRRYRWPTGVTCLYCDSVNTIKKGTTSKGAQRYRCHSCDSSFNDLTGTVFAERGLSLPEMFHIIRRIDEVKIARIAQQLDRSYQAVLDFAQEVQAVRTEASEIELSGVCGCDDGNVNVGENEIKQEE